MDELSRQYGPLLSGRDLALVLGLPSPEALRQAFKRGHVPIPVFSLPHRRGKFALTRDAAAWLSSMRNAPSGSPRQSAAGEAPM